MLRVTMKFVDASTGAHLWAETYDRTFTPDAIFALQDELVPRIVSTVADWYGVLPHSMSEAVRLKPLDQLTPYEALLRSFGYYEHVVPAEHAVAESALERAVQQAPAHGMARFAQKRDPHSVLAEHRILRSVVVLELQEELGRPLTHDEAAPLHELFDVIAEYSSLALMDKRGEGVGIILERTRALAGRLAQYRVIDDQELQLIIPAADPLMSIKPN